MGMVAVGELIKMLNALGGRSAYTASAAVYAKLHIGDPGTAGANNPAAETTRQAVTFGSDAANVGGNAVLASTADTVWTNLAASETLTHVSLWTAATAGTFLGKDDLLAAQAVNIGGIFRIASGVLTLTLNPGT